MNRYVCAIPASCGNKINSACLLITYNKFEIQKFEKYLQKLRT